MKGILQESKIKKELKTGKLHTAFLEDTCIHKVLISKVSYVYAHPQKLRHKIVYGRAATKY